jgi:hypothetical protein
MFEGWSNFFITTGAAGGTLVGLLFVVVTLGTGLPTARKLAIAHASLTPALYSFASVLLQSMVVLVPWPSDGPSGVLPDLRRCGIDHTSAISPFRHRRLNHTLPFLRHLPNLGPNPGVD